MKQRTTQIKAYKLDVSQTSRDGSFRCPCCGAKISPDDHSEATYTLLDTKLKGSNLDELVIGCKSCLSTIHLCGFLGLLEKGSASTFEL
jgi:hypothetical protein